MSRFTAQIHLPVLEQEILAWLQPEDQGLYVDATLGLGGHTRSILESSRPGGQVIGFEWDEEAAGLAAERLENYGDRLQIVRASYGDLQQQLARLEVDEIDGLIADFGVSSLQLDRAERGFSFKGDAPLDMRMDRRRPRTAAMLVATLSESELADVFYHYGEERQARRIASFLVKSREREPVETTGQLARIVAESVPVQYHPRKVHVATKVFQALRIAVNGELDNIFQLLQAAPEVLVRGGRICLITFHSLEDRIVKRGLATNQDYRVLTKKPVEPSAEEIKSNPRARSARLRVAARA